MRSEQEFRSFFRCVTDKDPYPYQVRLASEPIQSRAISVPTGAGKTAAAIVAWLWRLKTDTNNTPRRLVYSSEPETCYLAVPSAAVTP
jgi:CRISPR-associated endonuclease/helicase Cas3